MPWHKEKRDGKICVVKDDDGAVEGCHDSEEKANAQLRALYANEGRTASMELPGVTAKEAAEALMTLARASAITSSVAPLAPPRSWFEVEEASGPTSLTFTDDGRVFGHLALWETCHRGFLNGQFSQCIQAPRSQTNYEQFYAGGRIQTAEGEQISVGRLTYDTSHAPLTADLRAAAAHYDQTGSVGAFVRARDGQYGIWVSGAVRSDLSPEGLRDLRANPPSGDWRQLRPGNLELVASLAVPVPGFPVTRSQLALSASLDGELEVTALILTYEPPPVLTAADFYDDIAAISAELA